MAKTEAFTEEGIVAPQEPCDLTSKTKNKRQDQQLPQQASYVDVAYHPVSQVMVCRGLIWLVMPLYVVLHPKRMQKRATHVVWGNDICSTKIIS